MNEISVVLTMDCEPTIATSHPTATGPRDWAHSERAITGYVDIAREYGFPVTFFVHPETILEQHAMFKELQGQGHCIGLHMHPWKYALWRHGGRRFMDHYGGLSEDDQVALLSEASALWQAAMGVRPLYFRPGTFSANDAIFRVLARLGFHGGSVSAPGRVLPAIRAIWTATEPDPHRGNATFRQLPGELDFGNMPLSADFSRLLDMGQGRKRHADFRPDDDWPGRFGISYRTIAENILAQLRERAPAIPVLNAISHNMFEFRDAADPFCQRYRTMLDEMAGACQRAGVRPKGATIGDIAGRARQLPPVKEEFAYI